MSEQSWKRISRLWIPAWAPSWRLIGEKRSKLDRQDEAIGADVPIRTADQDRLRRTAFAARIATILSELNLDEGRVFAIRGGWGHGKSSLKNLIIEKLGALDDGADWVEFNPWQWGDADAIAKALFRQVADKLGGGYASSSAQRAATFRRYAAVLTEIGEPLTKASSGTQTISTILASASVLALASAVGFTLPSAATVAAVLAGLAVAAPLIGKGLAALGRDRWSEPLDQIRHSLERSLRKLERPLVIFVDDIDRLEPDQIRLLFRQIKVNANLPNLAFVLLFQPSIVEAALDPIAENQGREFLEKIVQANFDLPAVSLSIVHASLTEEISRLAGLYATEENGFQQVRWGNVLVGCIQPYVRNLRDARRLLSSIAIHLPLHAGGEAFEVNIIDFLGLETLRVFEPDLHGSLFLHRDILLQSSRFGGDRRDEEQRALAEKLVEIVPEQRREIVRGALKELFPTIGWAFGASHFGSDWHAGWIAEKRVCTARFFPRYFELQTPQGEISESEFVNLLSVSDHKEQLLAAIANIEDRKLLPSLAARLDESVDRLPVESANALLPAMFSVGQKLVSRRASDPFNSPWVSAWRAVSWYLQKLPTETRGALAITALEQTGALSVAAILIHLSDPADRKEEEQEQFEPTLDSATLQALKQEWLRQIEALASLPGRLLDHPDLLSLLYRWRDYSGSFDAPRDWVTEAIQTKLGFAAVVSRMMSSGTSQAWGDKVAARFDNFHRETIEDFIGVDATRKRLEAIDDNDLSEDQRHAIQVLREHLDEWSGVTPRRRGRRG